MTTATERLTLSIPLDIKAEIDAVKQREFYDMSYAELYRRMIRLGLNKTQEAEKKSRAARCPEKHLGIKTGGINFYELY